MSRNHICTLLVVTITLIQEKASFFEDLLITRRYQHLKYIEFHLLLMRKWRLLGPTDTLIVSNEPLNLENKRSQTNVWKPNMPIYQTEQYLKWRNKHRISLFTTEQHSTCHRNDKVHFQAPFLTEGCFL